MDLILKLEALCSCIKIFNVVFHICLVVSVCSVSPGPDVKGRVVDYIFSVWSESDSITFIQPSSCTSVCLINAKYINLYLMYYRLHNPQTEYIQIFSLWIF